MEHLTVYLSGEIHTDWRDVIRNGALAAGLDIAFTGPVTDHDASDDCGGDGYTDTSRQGL